jgi:uncharacterized membrane protein YidH (DUF202 family)
LVLKATLSEGKGQARESIDLVIRYVKQETLTPLKSILKYVGFGVGGALLSGFGVVLLLLGILRLLQTETGTSFTGNLSWLPYLITLVVGVVVIVASLSLARRKKN